MSIVVAGITSPAKVAGVVSPAKVAGVSAGSSPAASDRQYLIPGWGYVNTDGTARQYLIPGAGYLNAA